MLHGLNLLVEGGDLGSVLGAHGHFTVASLLHDQVLLLNVLELFGLSLLLELGHLTSAVLDLALLLLEDFDLVEAGFELLVEGIDVAEVRV